MSEDEMFSKLDSSYQAHMKEQEIINAFIAALQKKAKDLVSEHFAEEVHNLSAEGYKALERKIYDKVSNLAVDVTNVFHNHMED